ncbi:MAG TPA: protein kinase [Bryobacteraceae bacterium]|nr:protein kinase [Bryobacteraceae bacterium]
MPLAGGTRIGPYEILTPIGAGGMGEVYRARDTKLEREVAIKVLPAAVAEDPDRLARFEREAKVLASLNHPNIAQIYGVEQRALVMELVEGEALKGPLPLDTALNYASQIADALEAAHEKGITHRDLKPANIMITVAGVVKVLDFGLAAVAQSPTATSDPAQSPTLTMGATQAGTLLGTASYMAPEQARGKPVDKRADIWAFGCVLYEMLAGEKAFDGEDVAEVLAAVIHKEPDLSRLPEQVRGVVERCLRKDPRQRMRDIGDVRLALNEPQIPEKLSRKSARPILPWALTTLLAGALAIALVVLWPRPVDRPLMRLSVELGAEAFLEGPTTNTGTFALSPDGSRLVYGTRGADGQTRLAVRRLDQAQAVVLAGTEGGVIPFFSPNGQWIGFSAAGKLKKISAEGGAATVLCDAPNFRGAAWTEDGFIIAALDTQGPLVRVTENGGFYKPLTQLDKAAGESTHRWPQVLPGGKTILFTSHTTTGNYEDASIVAQSLATGQRSVMVKGGSYGRYVPAGFLLFVHSGSLLAARMDADQLKLTGEPAPVVEAVASNAVSGAGGFDFSRNGLLVFQSGESVHQESIYWVSDTGTPQLVSSLPGAFTLRLAPDGLRVALSVDQGSSRDVWIYDLQRDTRTRLTFQGSSSNPIWTRDGLDIVYAAQLAGSNEIQSVRADGTGDVVHLYSSPSALQMGSFSPDGKRLAFAIQAAGTGADIWSMPVERLPGGNLKGGPPEPFLKTPFNEQDAEFSPDGRWLAYTSSDSGRPEVYVRSFPGPGGRWQISNGGGSFPVWSRKGHELFYIGSDRMMVASYQIGRDSFSAEKPRVWTEHFINPTPFYRRFDPVPDGRRFLQLRPLLSAGKESPTELTFLLNFFDELRRRVPAAGAAMGKN